MRTNPCVKSPLGNPSGRLPTNSGAFLKQVWAATFQFPRTRLQQWHPRMRRRARVPLPNPPQTSQWSKRAGRLGYLTPIRDHVNAVANVMYGLPPSQPPPPRSQQRAEDEYEETRRFRDRCHHENKRTYYAQGRWLFCDNCKRRWRAVETADTSAWVIDDRDDPRRKTVFSGKSRSSSWQSAPPASGSRTTTPTFPPSSTSGFGARPKRGSRTAPSHVPPPHQEPDAWDVTNDMSGSLSETYSEELEERNDSEA